MLLTGVDQTSEQTVHARTWYRADEMVWNARFRSIFVQTDGDSRIAVEIRKVHDIERL